MHSFDLLYLHSEVKPSYKDLVQGVAGPSIHCNYIIAFTPFPLHLARISRYCRVLNAGVYLYLAHAKYRFISLFVSSCHPQIYLGMIVATRSDTYMSNIRPLQDSVRY